MIFNLKKREKSLFLKKIKKLKMTTNNYPNQNQMQYIYTNEALTQQQQPVYVQQQPIYVQQQPVYVQQPQPVYVVQQPVVVNEPYRRSGNGTALVTGMLVGGMLAGGMRGPRPYMGPRMGPRMGYRGTVGCCDIF